MVKCGGQCASVAEVVSEFHGTAAVTRLAGGVDHHEEGPIQIGGDARLVGEEGLRGQRANLELQLDGDSLPGAKILRVSLPGRRSRYIEKILQSIHIYPAGFYRAR
jgi:hypothetical protein